MRNKTRALLIISMTLMLSSLAFARPEDEHFSVKEYNKFHDLLHPLQHDALPAKDFKRIRLNAGELARRGDAMVRLGVPKGTEAKHVEEFRSQLKKFKDALGQLRQHSKSGTDEQLEGSFGAVHDSFEMLAGMLPRKHSN